jgi:glycerophosphoryl diester phosphodiesterase
MTDELTSVFRYPIAHRGLHDLTAGRMENSSSAFNAALEAGYGIECDVQLTADNKAVVFHDYQLDSLTDANGTVRQLPSDLLIDINLTGTRDRILPLSDLLELVNGRRPLVVEIKRQLDGGTKIADITLDVCRNYQGILAIKSFDPGVIRRLRQLNCHFPLGIVAEHALRKNDENLTLWQRITRTTMFHGLATKYDFISYDREGLPNLPCTIASKLLGVPIMSWTVKSAAQAQQLPAYVQQIVFEGYLPPLPDQPLP